MGMFGYLMLLTVLGDRIIMEDGFGIPLSVGPGFLMILGDGVFPITEDGTGEAASVGLGFLQFAGALRGCTGIGDQATLLGVL